ncbi:MAG: histidinol-phosphatase [Catalinimonas sp.]
MQCSIFLVVSGVTNQHLADHAHRRHVRTLAARPRSPPMTNYHGHCCYCDGKDHPEAYAEAALAAGMTALGISSHAPVPFETSWNMAEPDLPRYLAEVCEVRDRYRDRLPIYVGLETDFVPGRVAYPPARARELGLDYTIGSIHFVDAFADGRPWEIDGPHRLFLDGLEQIFKHDAERAVRRYFTLTRQMIQEAPPRVVGHLDKIKMQAEGGKLFDERAHWYREEVERTLSLIAEQGLTVEVNTRGLYKRVTTEPYPSRWILERMRALDIPVMINSDAHHPRELTAHFREAVALLQDVGYRATRELSAGGWHDAPLHEWLR